jgi:hypothetical protein
VGLSPSRPTPNLEDQASVFIPLPETWLHRYTSGHWVARVPRDRHFPYPLTWDPEGNSYLIHVNMDQKILSFRVRALPTCWDLTDKAPGERNHQPAIRTARLYVKLPSAQRWHMLLKHCTQTSSVSDGAKTCHRLIALSSSVRMTTV